MWRWARMAKRGKGREEVEGFEDFVHELKRFYARGRGYELLDFEMKIAGIAKETLGAHCFFNFEKEKVLFEEEIIQDILYLQEREDILKCSNGRHIVLKHKVYLVMFDRYSLDWMGMAPLDIDAVEVR
jgi:hypothetical protein